MKTFTYTEAKALLTEFGRFTVTSYEHYGLTVLDTDSGEFAVGTEYEAEDAWEEALDSYLDEVVLPDLEGTLANYFDRDAWKRDAKFDGRGHALSCYDGNEVELNKGCDLVAFRVN